MPRGVMMAARAGNRMQARQSYRTINRMERRRGLFRDALDGGDDGPYDTAPQAAPPPPPVAAAAVPSYVTELEQLGRLHAEGLLSAEEYEAKKRQVLAL